MPKRKNSDHEDDDQPAKRQDVKTNGSQRHLASFRTGLFDEEGLKIQTDHYASSEPYKHGVINELVNSELLKSVRNEIQESLSFTPKETDIYKIFQSGDLANLDGLDDASLKLLPSLKQLRDALYSEVFREYLCTVTDCPPISGQKTDMAINVYTPGCHLLCHDDVIGTRRISYILYLTDPDEPWRPEWGGALRLYPTRLLKHNDGKDYPVPEADHVKSIPPAFNQLSFFAVQPGQSFHDVEEVFAPDSDRGDGKTSRTRMAISGWYHRPQEGEKGYEQAEIDDAEPQSSLAQLEGTKAEHDLPQASIKPYSLGKDQKQTATVVLSVADFDDKDIDFLLQYISPQYLTPDTLNDVAEPFEEDCSIILGNFLSKKFCERIRIFVDSQDASSKESVLEKWRIAVPPHKHRFLYRQGPLTSTQETNKDGAERSPFDELVEDLFPSPIFRKWFYFATGNVLRSHDVMARRFRRGQDYTLAQTYTSEEPRIELCLSLTPTSGWGDDDVSGNADESANDIAAPNESHNDTPSADRGDVGGYLAYMAGEDDESDDEGSNHGVDVPADMSTGGRAVKAKNPKADPAIYQAQGDEDDGALFTMPAGWNQLGIVLRDKGTMRFVKYVSQSAKGDRWDVFGQFELEEDDEEGDGEGDGERDEEDDAEDDEDGDDIEAVKNGEEAEEVE